MKRVVAVVSVVAGAAFGVHAVGCDSDAQSHVYVASLYEADSNCLEPSTSLGFIDTPNGDLDCAPTCIVFPPSPAIGGNERVYVSSMCGPYPTNADVSGTDPGCPAALAAWAAGGPGSCESGTEDAGAGNDGAVEDGAADTAPAVDTGSPLNGDDADVDRGGVDASDGAATHDAPSE
jgi:hypothetical protein